MRHSGLDVLSSFARQRAACELAFVLADVPARLALALVGGQRGHPPARCCGAGDHPLRRSVNVVHSVHVGGGGRALVRVLVLVGQVGSRRLCWLTVAAEEGDQETDQDRKENDTESDGHADDDDDASSKEI